MMKRLAWVIAVAACAAAAAPASGAGPCHRRSAYWWCTPWRPMQSACAPSFVYMYRWPAPWWPMIAPDYTGRDLWWPGWYGGPYAQAPGPLFPMYRVGPGRYIPMYSSYYYPRSFWRGREPRPQGAPPIALHVQEDEPQLEPLADDLRDLGDSYFHAGRYGLAAEAYRRALRRSSRDLYARTGRLLALIEQGRYHDAAKPAHRLLHSGQSLRLVRSAAARLYDQPQAHAARLIGQLEQAASKAPHDPARKRLLAFLQAAIGDPRQAAHICEQLAAAGSTHSDINRLAKRLRKDWGIRTQLQRPD